MTQQDLGALLQRAQVALQNGALDEAAGALQVFLRHVPDHPGARVLAGIVAARRGQLQEGIAHLRAAVRLAPDFLDGHNALANVLAMSGDLESAIASYRRALAIAPQLAFLHFNLGAVLLEHGSLDEAASELAYAARLDPTNPDVLAHLGHAHQRAGRLENAVEAYRAHVALRPANVDDEVYRQLAKSLMRLGKPTEAVDTVRAWLERAPGHPVAEHVLASYGATTAPARATDAYLREVFDHFAPTFDAQLAAVGYRAPEHARDILARAAKDAQLGSLADVGCGTGALGPLVRPLVRRLVGVDLSPNMLERARARGVYDELVEAEAAAFLESRPARFDAVTALDTVNYFGDVRRLFSAAATAAASDALLLFTIERMPDGVRSEAGYELQQHGRYRHDASYVIRELESAGFAVRESTDLVLRKEYGDDVPGTFVTARLVQKAVGA